MNYVKDIWIISTMKKILPSLLILLFIGVFWYFFWDEYRDFQQKAEQVRSQQIKITQEIQDFSVENIRTLGSVEFYHTPYKPLLDDLVNSINNANQRVYIEVYIFTEKRIKAAIKSAQARGVEVRVILEKNPYLAPRLNDSIFNELKQAGIDIVWSDSSDYALNHTKLMIIDDDVVISTGNISYSTFAYNKDFFIITDDQTIRENMLFLFENDFVGEKISPYEDNIVLSPAYSRAKFQKLFQSADSSIQMYFQYFQDDDLAAEFIQKSQDGIRVEAIVSESYAEDNEDEIQYLRDQWIDIRYMKKPKMHAKAILIDEKYLFIWSINFSSYSLDANREVWILINNPEIISKFQGVFDDDFSSAEK